MDVNQTCGDHFAICTNMESFYGTQELIHCYMSVIYTSLKMNKDWKVTTPSFPTEGSGCPGLRQK